MFLLSKVSTFCKYYFCESSKADNELFCDQFSVLYQTRFCTQKDFSIAVCMDGDIRLLKKPFSLSNLDTSEDISSISGKSFGSKIAACGSDLYVVSESDQNCSLEKFSTANRKWKALPSLLDRRDSFCVCCFMQKIFVLSGNRCDEKNLYKSCNSCMTYDIKNNKWTYISSMNKGRGFAACTVFEGKIVVSGGWHKANIPGVDISRSRLSSVEAYNSHENKWVRFPHMLERRSEHDIVSMGNRMFVIGGRIDNTCEVFDSVTNKFTYIENTPKIKDVDYITNNHLVCIGCKVYLIQQIMMYQPFKEKGITMLYYDVQKMLGVQKVFQNFNVLKLSTVQRCQWYKL